MFLISFFSKFINQFILNYIIFKFIFIFLILLFVYYLILINVLRMGNYPKQYCNHFLVLISHVPQWLCVLYQTLIF